MTRVRRIDKHLGVIHFDPARYDGVLATLDDETGFLRVDAKLTRTGVFSYADRDGNKWGELRTDAEVFHPAAMRSFELTPMTDDHPDEFVNATNIKDTQVGTVANIRRDGDFLVGSIVITDAKVIQKIRDGKVELSCGYTAAVITDSGTTDSGESYHARQTQIQGNHVALVSQGRAGSECAVPKLDKGDAFTVLQEDSPMLVKIKIGDAEYEVPKAVADALQADAQKKADAEAKAKTKVKADEFPPPADDEEEEKEEDGKKDSLAEKFAKLQAKLDAMDADRGAAPTRIDDRVELVADAREVLGADAQTRGVSDAALMRAIALKVRPKLESKLDANKKNDGYLRASYESAMEKHRADKENDGELRSTLFDAHFGGSRNDASKELADSIGAYFNGKAVE